MSAEHVCDETDGDWIACINGERYGPCEDRGCGGVHDPLGPCECSCHAAPTPEGTQP